MEVHRAESASKNESIARLQDELQRGAEQAARSEEAMLALTLTASGMPMQSPQSSHRVQQLEEQLAEAAQIMAEHEQELTLARGYVQKSEALASRLVELEVAGQSSVSRSERAEQQTSEAQALLSAKEGEAEALLAALENSEQEVRQLRRESGELNSLVYEASLSQSQIAQNEVRMMLLLLLLLLFLLRRVLTLSVLARRLPRRRSCRRCRLSCTPRDACSPQSR